MADEPKPTVPVLVKHGESGKVKIINPKALERYTKAGYVQIGDDGKPDTAAPDPGSGPAPAKTKEGK